NGNYCNDVKPNEHHQSVLSHSENYNLETSASRLSVRFNDSPPKLYLFNKSLQEQVPVLQVAGPSKGKYSRAELEEHREFMLTKIHIAVRKKKWRSVKRLIGVAFKTFTNY
ncbi:10315_t:CDS:2, partial [Entrophospora sp. SA101]